MMLAFSAPAGIISPMATLTIRQLDDGAYERLKVRASINRRSLEAEARHLLEERARPLDAIVDDFARFHQTMLEKHGVLPDSVDDIRALRDEE